MQSKNISEERRYALRINTSLGAEVTNRNGEDAKARITNLSVGGLTLQVDTATARHIQVIDSSTGEPYFPVEALVAFTLAIDNSQSQIEVSCRLIHRHRLSQNSFKLGMMMIAINEEQRALLARYVDLMSSS